MRNKRRKGKLRRRRGFGGRDDGRLIFGSESGSAAVIGRWNFFLGFTMVLLRSGDGYATELILGVFT